MSRAKPGGRQRSRAPNRKSRPRVAVDAVKDVSGFVKAAAGLVAVILPLVVFFRPGCQPQPPQDRGTGEIGKPQVISPVTYRSFLRKQELPVGNVSQQLLNRIGVMVEFNYHVLGFGGKKLPLHWELDDAKTNDLVAEDRRLLLTPSTNDESRTFFLWVPVPKTRRSYYVTGKLWQPGGVTLVGDFRTSPFPGLARRA